MYIYESSDSASSIIHFLPFDININTAKFVKRSHNSLVDETRRDMCFQQRSFVSFSSILGTLKLS